MEWKTADMDDVRSMADAGRRRPPSAPRRTVVLAAGMAGWALASTALLWAGGRPLAEVRAPGPASFDTLLAAGGTGAAWLLLTWVAASFAIAVLATVPGAIGRGCAAYADRAVPAVLRKLALAVVGAAVVMAPAVTVVGDAAARVTPAAPAAVAGMGRTLESSYGAYAVTAVAGPVPGAAGAALVDRPGVAHRHAAARATAAPHSTADPADTADTADIVVDRPGVSRWMPTRPPPAPRQHDGDGVRLVTSTPHREHAVRDEVVVRAGDSLWQIAARHLCPDATAAEVATEWPRWYAANRTLLGSDPSIIRPGQVLRPPQ